MKYSHIICRLSAVLISGLIMLNGCSPKGGTGVSSPISGNPGSETSGDTGLHQGIIDSSTLKMDQKYLYGICYDAFEAHKFNGFDYKKSIDAIKDLGVTSIRLWMHSDYVMSDPVTYKEKDLALMKEIVAYIQSKGIEIIGMNHHWFTGKDGDYMVVPVRNMKEGSAYTKFLLNYDMTWYNLVKAFPEITYWEIGNEWNNDTFLHPYNYNDTGMTFTVSEKVKITTDMLYYASRGIHRANPKAITMLGGLVDILKTGYGNAKNFLSKIYQGILSGDFPSTNPDHYFQTISWHPYAFESAGQGEIDESWIEHNISIYEMIKDYEGHDKPVFFTEFGWSDMGNPDTDAKQAEQLKEFFKTVQKRMPFVKTVHWFRMFNDASATSWGAEMECYFGLFREPGKEKGFSLKEKGKAYYEVAGGKGDMKKYEE